MQRTNLARRVATVAFGTTLSIAAVGGSAWACPGGGNGTVSTAKGSAPHQIQKAAQPASNADFSGHGANVHGPYDSTRDGRPSGNGNAGGKSTGKPCAGCVGKADNKNPKGQLPGGSDHNAGYECDRNHGIGQGNPAHTGCTTSVSVPVVTPPVVTPPVVTPPVVSQPGTVVLPVASQPGTVALPTHVTRTPKTRTPAPVKTQVLGVSVTRAPRAVAVEASRATAPTTLPFTGAPTGTLVLAGLLLVGSGAAVTVSGRRSAR